MPSPPLSTPADESRSFLNATRGQTAASSRKKRGLMHWLFPGAASSPATDPAQIEVKHCARELIRLANRVESRSCERADVESTNAGDVRGARELTAAQERMLSAIGKARRGGITLEELRSELVEPVLEGSIVSDMAWLLLEQVMGTARRDP